MCYDKAYFPSSECSNQQCAFRPAPIRPIEGEDPEYSIPYKAVQDLLVAYHPCHLPLASRLVDTYHTLCLFILHVSMCVSAHAKAVRGVAIDALTMEVHSGSADKTVKVQTESCS